MRAKTEAKFARTEAESSKKKAKEEAYDLGVAETQATLKAQVPRVCRLYYSQVWNEALKQAEVEASSLAHSAMLLAPSASDSFFFKSWICSLAIFNCSSASSEHLVWSSTYFWAPARPASVLSLALVISFSSSLAFERSASEFLRVRVASKRLSRSSSRDLLCSLASSSSL